MTDRGGEASHAIDVRSGYLALLPRRDVIERPIDGVFNFNGWDVGKALRLMLKGNAVLFEWLESPIYYHSEPPVVAALRSLADRVLDADNLRSHYPRVAEGQWLRWIAGRETVPRKKYLYALRPALVLWHLRMHPARPPMAIEQLLATTHVSEAIRSQIEAFIAEKRSGSELGEGLAVADFDRMIIDELHIGRELYQVPLMLTQRGGFPRRS